jgi:hypothetical protein
VEQRHCRETNDVETPGPAIDSSKGENMMQYVLALVATLALSGPPRNTPTEQRANGVS